MGDAGGCPCADVPKDPAVGSEMAVGRGPEPRPELSVISQERPAIKCWTRGK